MLATALMGAISFVLGRPNRDDGSTDFHPLDADKILGSSQPRDAEEVPNATHQEISRFISEVRWRRYEGA